VVNAFRDAEFTGIISNCLYGETTIGAVAQNDAGPPSEPPIVACIVARGPEPPDEEPTDRFVEVYADNVGCSLPARLQARVRALLDGL
jgi:hypothetical protein